MFVHMMKQHVILSVVLLMLVALVLIGVPLAFADNSAEPMRLARGWVDLDSF